MEHEMVDMIPLYALDALEAHETIEFEAHLESCPECDDTLGGYRASISRLVLDEPASSETWSRISAAIGSESGAGVDKTLQIDTRSWQWIASIAAAAALALGGLLVAQLNAAEEPVADGVVASAEVAAQEDGAIVGDFMVEDVAVARVVLTPDGRGYVIPTQDLAALEPMSTYQLWVINDTDDVISAGVLGPEPAPSTFTWSGPIAGFALTREVAEGVVSSAGDVVSVIADL
jgi:anti-sigma-K factor RskA